VLRLRTGSLAVLKQAVCGGAADDRLSIVIDVGGAGAR
jgi:hypothetical protein